MNKEESLAFLQNCIEKVKRATAQDIQFYKEVYDRECDSKERMSEREEETEISRYEGDSKMKKEIIGYVGEYNDGWFF